MCWCQLPQRHLAGRREVLSEGKDRAHLPRGRRLAGQQTLSSPRQLLLLAHPSPRSTSPADAGQGFTPTFRLLPMCCCKAEPAEAVESPAPGFPCLGTGGGESHAEAPRPGSREGGTPRASPSIFPACVPEPRGKTPAGAARASQLDPVTAPALPLGLVNIQLRVPG